MRIRFEEAERVMNDMLISHGTPADKARIVAYEMARNSLEGTYTHGINRFARLVRSVDSGTIVPSAEPELVASCGAMSRYEGHMGFGIVNAIFAMDRAIDLASEHGIGLVSLAHSNHWLRAATYGYRALECGCAAICFTNTTNNMPAWGATDSRLGNNPFVMAFPRKNGQHMIVDSAMSQFSYGALEVARLAGKQMSVAAGFDKNGNITTDPSAVLETRRPLSAGYWKGAAMSFMIDIFSSCLSGGFPVADIAEQKEESALSQVFIAIDYRKIVGEDEADRIAERAIKYLKGSTKAEGTKEIVYPGERMMRVREENLREGIPVDERVWSEILSL